MSEPKSDGAKSPVMFYHTAEAPWHEAVEDINEYLQAGWRLVALSPSPGTLMFKRDTEEGKTA